MTRDARPHVRHLGSRMKLKFSTHAMQRMFSRHISPEDVRAVVERGETIATYPEDQPFPSSLRLGYVNERAVHVVIGYDVETDTGHIITAYVPNPDLWQQDMRTRKRS